MDKSDIDTIEECVLRISESDGLPALATVIQHSMWYLQKNPRATITEALKHGEYMAFEFVYHVNDE
jgi:hypothetical protein